jgi:hypothetical protein
MIDRDRIIEFIETRRRLLAAIASGLLGVLVLLLVASLFFGHDAGTRSGGKLSAEQAAAERANALLPEELWLPAEPLDIPAVQLSREGRSKWSVEEAKQWYTEPGDAALDELEAVSRKQIDEILESVP